MKEKICLIIPPSAFLLDERVFPSLGVLKVASSLELAGWPVEVLDLSGYTNFEEIMMLHASKTTARIFGITTTTPQMPATARVLKALRKVRVDAKVIIGGPHPTLILAAKKQEDKRKVIGRACEAYGQLEDMFDIVVAGDGEDAIFDAVSFIQIPNKVSLIDADDPKGSLFLTNQRLEETAWPARHLIDLPGYKYDVAGYKATSLIAQLGCPFACGFCGGRRSPMLRRIRMRSTQNILDEIRFLYDTYGYRGFMFYDDELNVNKKMVELMNGISDIQSEVGEDFRLRGFVKAELFTQEQAEVMYRAGFRQLLTGFESGSPRILENMNKKATREDNTRAVEFAKKAGLTVKALMSCGHPGESHETIEETKKWLLEVQPDDFDYTIITTYPGSPYYDDAVETKPGIWTYTYEKTGDKLHAYELDYRETADYYKGDPDMDGGYKAYVFTDHISAEELVKERDNLEREVRTKLNIPFNSAAASVNYEHSMGQGPLPHDILRAVKSKEVKKIVSLNVTK
ncbi:MAG: B12-binding domain-containing radical SAM protein [Candidatus Thorarchaeota archaeon]|jgi:radical SAM superfamily enzyme YgiQ (UPF0313 family)